MSTVNVSDTGAFDFGASVGPNTSTASLLREDDHDVMFGDNQDDLQNFVCSPFIVCQARDDEVAPITQGQFKTLNEKLDSLLQSSKSSSTYKYLFESHKAVIETLTKELTKNIDKSTKAAEIWRKQLGRRPTKSKNYFLMFRHS